MTYPATTYAEGVELTITSGNQLHEIINGDATEEINTESGMVPSVRKALADSMLFKPAIAWAEGSVESDPFQTRLYGEGIYWAPAASNETPISMGTNPNIDGNWFLAPVTGGETISRNTNLLSNHNFIIKSPDDITHPSVTPTDYVAGTQVFSGVFVGTDIVGLTYIDGRVSWTSGTLYFSVPNSGSLEYVDQTDFVASVADFDGKPRTRGVSFALVGDEYRITVGVDALEDVSGNATPLGSVKFEQGSVATRHEVKSLFDIYGHPNMGIYDPRAFGAKFDGLTDDTINIQNCIDRCSNDGGGVVTLPGGTAIVDMLNEQNPSQPGGIFVRSNVEITGTGSTVIKGKSIPGASNFVYVCNFENCENAKIRNLKIDCNKPAGETDEKQWHGIRWDGDTDNCTVDNVEIVNGKGDGIWIVKNPGYTKVSLNGKINNVRTSGFNRQDISLVEGDGFTITNSIGGGTLDVESDSAVGRVNQNHFIENNNYDKIRISPLTGLNGVKTNIIAENNRCNELSTWGGDGDQLINNIVKGPVVISQCGKITFRGGSCHYIGQNVTNLNSVKKLVIDDVAIESDTALIGIELKDVINAEIKPNIKLTAVGSIGIQQNNNSTQAEGEISIEGGSIDTESHCIDLTVVGLGSTTQRIKGNSLKSTSGRSISKIGASDQGEVVIEDNDIYAQPVVRSSTRITSRENRFHSVASINYDFNGGDDIIIVDDKYYDTVPSVSLSNNSLTGSITIRNVAGENVTIGSSVFSFSGTTAVDLLIDELVTSSDTPFYGLAATLRAGSKIRVIGSTLKYGRWWNGSVWTDLA